MKTITLMLFLLLTCGFAMAQGVEACGDCSLDTSCYGCHLAGWYSFVDYMCHGCQTGQGFNNVQSVMNPKMLAAARKRYSRSLNNHGLDVAVLTNAMDFLRISKRPNVQRVPGHSSKEYLDYMKNRNSFAFCPDALKKQIAGINERLARGI